MAGEWRESTISEIAAPVRNAIVGGPFGSNLVSRDYVDVGVPVIRGQNLGARWVSGEFVYVTDAKADSLDANLARPGDIVFTQRGTLGQVSVVPSVKFDRYLVSQSQMKLTVNRELADPLFIYYVFSTTEQQDYIRQNAIQTGVPHTNLGILRSTPVLLPPLPEQRAIAHILGTLDDKIELNRRINETLEAMARALFKSWFVDFDPVRAKAEGRDPGLPQPLADLFPTRLVDSELGEIPQGWKVVPLSDLTTVITKGTTPTQEDIDTAPDEGPPVHYVRVNVIDGNGEILFEKLTAIPESVHLGVLKRSVLRTEDVLYTIAGTIGRVSIVRESLLPANTNQAVAIIRPKSKVPSAFLALALRQVAFREELHSNIVHAVQANLSLGTLSKAQVVVPPEDTLPQLFAPTQVVVERTALARAQSRTLAALRDALLPKLVSGELRVKSAERIVEIA
jgi:type I restriction enzyme S subunit